MLSAIFKAIFGTKSQRDVKKMLPLVARINELEQNLQALTDDELKAKTQEFRDRLANGETLDDILPDAYAVVREASNRVLHMKHFHVQILGGIVLLTYLCNSEI